MMVVLALLLSFVAGVFYGTNATIAKMELLETPRGRILYYFIPNTSASTEIYSLDSGEDADLYEDSTQIPDEDVTERKDSLKDDTNL